MVNVPEDFQDYDDDDPLLDKRKGRMKYWKTLKELQKEWKETDQALNLIDWIEEKYGFKAIMVDNYFSDDYHIVDEKKYLIYILKYGN